ncbi:MAG: hypothetical protein ACPGSB_09550 [Opitutales bacterium]
MKIKVVLLAALAATLIPSLISAEEGGKAKGVNKLFASIDADGDGFISKDEATANNKMKKLAKGFDTYDTDQDGQISPEEFAAFKSAGAAKDKENKKEKKKSSEEE